MTISRRALLMAAVPGVRFHRGVNFTAEHPDKYDSPHCLRLLDELKGFGVDSLAFVPYGFTPRGQGTVRFGGERMWEKDDDIAKLAEAARARGFRVFLKPQIWVGRGWPGDLEFTDAGERRRWFDSYHAFVEHYAGQARRIRADLFAVGCEFAKLTKYTAEWRALVRTARGGYKGAITYCATQGPEFETMAWWDAVDYIGLNNYYVVPDSLDFAPQVEKLEAVQRRFRKPILFPEAGYSSVEFPNRDPWAENHRPVSLEAQTRCMEALCKAYWSKPWFAGVFWWKIGTNGFGGSNDRSHTPWRKPAMEVVKRYNFAKR